MLQVLYVLCILSLSSVCNAEFASGVTRSPKPTMGWRSWNYFGCECTQAITQGIVDGLAKKRNIGGKSLSLADVGYTYVGIDDCWQMCEDKATCDAGSFHDNVTGLPQVNTSMYPDLSGMVQYGKARGMQMAFYMNNCRCAEKTVTHYPEDAKFSMMLGFDGLKFDTAGLSRNFSEWAHQYTLLNTTMIIEGDTKNIDEVRDTCPYTMFRLGGDIAPYFLTTVYNANLQKEFIGPGLSRPGCWAFPDCLEVGVDRWKVQMDHIEQRTHFGLWVILSAPLIQSMDFRNDTAVDAVLHIIANQEAIQVSQTWAGLAGRLVSESNVSFNHTIYGAFDARRTSVQSFALWQVWSKPQPNGTQAVLVVNNDNTTQTVSVSLKSLGLSGVVSARDIWHHTDLPSIHNTIKTTLAPHDSLFLLLTPSPSSSSY